MNKSALIVEVKKRLGSSASKAGAERAIDAVLASISHGLKRDREVQLVGFGVFAVIKRAARRGFNPHTQRPMKIRGMKIVRFKAGLDLKAIA
ncbi:MAG: histone family protein DNA-binding protein [Verrucomicrobia bacterium]|nr:histone family protein DNA-binding protein [Verrucomicrobiota bacterium]